MTEPVGAIVLPSFTKSVVYEAQIDTVVQKGNDGMHHTFIRTSPRKDVMSLGSFEMVQRRCEAPSGRIPTGKPIKKSSLRPLVINISQGKTFKTTHRGPRAHRDG